VKRTAEPETYLNKQLRPRSTVRFTDLPRYVMLPQHWSAGLLPVVR